MTPAQDPKQSKMIKNVKNIENVKNVFWQKHVILEGLAQNW